MTKIKDLPAIADNDIVDANQLVIRDTPNIVTKKITWAQVKSKLALVFQTALGYTAEDSANKGAANGYAPLDSASKISTTYLPSYVDDVIEVANYAALPGTGETGKIYLTIDDGKIFRWSGSVYVQVTNGLIANLDDVPDSATRLAVSSTEKGTWNGKEDALGFTPVPNTRTISGHLLDNDISLSSGDVGLGNVPNTDFTGALIVNSTGSGAPTPDSYIEVTIGSTTYRIAVQDMTP